VRFTRSIADIERADLVVVPGTKATVEDLARLRNSGLADALKARANAGNPTLGICGGYQLLGQRIIDDFESGEGVVDGLALLPVITTFERGKLLRTRGGHCAWLDSEVGGYEIRHGRVTPAVDVHTGADAVDAHARDGHGDRQRHRATGASLATGESLFTADDGEPDGCRLGSVIGTSWHGVLEHDSFRRALLAHVASLRGRRFVPGTVSFAAAREARLDVLGDLVEKHLDTELLTALIEGGVPRDLPSVTTEVRPCVL
jgi:adenosylcobyric acid synthase